MKCRILTDSEFDYKLFKAVDTNTTDFAKREGQGYEGWCVEEVDCNGADAAIYTNDGKVSYFNRSNPYIGIRPAADASTILENGTVIRELENGLKEVEYGEYPQEKVSEELQAKLDQDLLDKQLEKTGMKYTVYTNDEEYPDVIKLFEVVDKDGNKYVNRDNAWYKVSPVIWTVNEQSGLALTKYMIQGGIPYGEFEPVYLSEFEKEFERTHPMKLPMSVIRMYDYRKINPTIIEGFVNEVLSKELVQAQEKEQKRENRRNSLKITNPNIGRYLNASLNKGRTFDDWRFTGIEKTLEEKFEDLMESLEDENIELEAALRYRHPRLQEEYIEGKRALRKTLLDFKANKKI